jgi:hypothetical protein
MIRLGVSAIKCLPAKARTPNEGCSTNGGGFGLCQTCSTNCPVAECGAHPNNPLYFAGFIYKAFLFSEIIIKPFTHEPHFGGAFVVYKLSPKMGTFLLLMIKNSLFKDKKKYIMILIFILTLV